MITHSYDSKLLLIVIKSSINNPLHLTPIIPKSAIVNCEKSVFSFSRQTIKMFTLCAKKQNTRGF